jgi:hypothetical protein
MQYAYSRKACAASDSAQRYCSTDILHQHYALYALFTQVNEDAVDSDHDRPVPVTSAAAAAAAAVTAAQQSTATTTTKITSRDKRGRKLSLERDLIDPLARRKRDVSPIA